jgi:phosphate transport system substrate-binding protein
MNAKRFFGALVLGCSLLSGATAAELDPNLPDYESVSGVSGNISSIGSDTLNNLMTLWSEQFAKHYPNVNIQIQGAGSSSAPPALTEGTANFGPMSREMKSSEIRAFEARHGYQPIAVPVAIDVVAVYVNKDNPIEGLTMPQVDAIFSATRLCGQGNDITRWGELGLTGEWKNRDFTLYSRNAVSGTYGFFKDVGLCGGDYKASINEQPGSASVVQGVSESTNGIGYSGIGYKTSSVRALPLAAEEGMPFANPDAEHAADGSYPMSRFLFVYVNKKPNYPFEPMQREFLKMVLSKEGQETVVRDGYIPLPASTVDRLRKELDL